MMSRPKVACEGTFHHLEINQPLRTFILDVLLLNFFYLIIAMLSDHNYDRSTEINRIFVLLRDENRFNLLNT